MNLIPGKFACRVVAALFEFNDSGDIMCDSGLKRGSLGICVPVR